MKSLKDLRKLSDADLLKELQGEQEALYKLRCQQVVDEIADTTQVSKHKRQIARINTLITENEKRTKD